MTLRARLALGILAIGIVLLVPLLLATRSLEQLGEQTEALRSSDFAANALLGRVRSSADAFSDAELALGVDTAPALVFQRMANALDRLDGLADSLNGVDFAPHGRELRALTNELRGLGARELTALLAGQTDRADAISADSVPPVLSRLTQVVRRMEFTVSRRIASRVGEAAVAIERSRERTLLAFMLAAGLAVGIAALLTWSIGRPVRALEEGMARVADGEFDHELRIPEDRRDEFGRLAQSFGSMTRQLAELDKLKAEFISVASHELKTPINVILGYVQLLQEEVFGPLSEKQREVLSTVDSQGQSLTRLVRHLLDISRFDSGLGRVEPRTFPLWDFVRDLERAFDVLAHQRDVQFAVTRADDVPDTVTWDYDRMNEVLGNLLSNAFKFTSRGGRVELTVDAVGDRVLLEVTDTGAGIAPDQLPRIFDKFFQADNQASASAKGTGLGLAIAKSIVEAHGGTIGCQSAPGRGTTFTIELPAHVPVRRGAASPRPHVAQAGPA